MIDINLLRIEKGGNPELVRESQRKRGASVDKVILLDQEWINLSFQADEVNKLINQLIKRIAPFGKNKTLDSKEALDIIKQKEDLVKTKNELVKFVNDKKIERDRILRLIGNIVDSSVIVSMDENDNARIKTFWPDGRSEDKELARREKVQELDQC